MGVLPLQLTGVFALMLVAAVFEMICIGVFFPLL